MIAICKCLKLFVVPRAVASVHNSVNYFRQFDSSLSHQTQDETSYKSIWKTKEIHQTWLHCQEGTHLSEKVSADIGNMHKLNKISSCQKLFTLFAIVRHKLNNIGLSIDEAHQLSSNAK